MLSQSIARTLLSIRTISNASHAAQVNTSTYKHSNVTLAPTKSTTLLGYANSQLTYSQICQPLTSSTLQTPPNNNRILTPFYPKIMHPKCVPSLLPTPMEPHASAAQRPTFSSITLLKSVQDAPQVVSYPIINVMPFQSYRMQVRLRNRATIYRSHLMAQQQQSDKSHKI